MSTMLNETPVQECAQETAEKLEPILNAIDMRTTYADWQYERVMHKMDGFSRIKLSRTLPPEKRKTWSDGDITIDTTKEYAYPLVANGVITYLESKNLRFLLREPPFEMEKQKHVRRCYYEPPRQTITTLRIRPDVQLLQLKGKVEGFACILVGYLSDGSTALMSVQNNAYALLKRLALEKTVSVLLRGPLPRLRELSPQHQRLRMAKRNETMCHTQ